MRALIRAQLADPLPVAASTLVAFAGAAPWVLGFDSSAPAVAAHIAFAMAFGPLALLVTALRPAAATCVAGGAWLMAGPWVLGYGAMGVGAWLVDTATGAALILVAAEALTRGAARRRVLLRLRGGRPRRGQIESAIDPGRP